MFRLRRRLLLCLPTALLALPTLLLTGGLPARAQGPEERIREYFTDCLNRQDLACLGEYWPAEKAVAVAKGERLRRSYFPDLRYAVREVIHGGERVVVIARITGQHGETPEGRLDLEEVYLYTWKDGRIVRGEVFSDRLTISQALGYRVEPGDDNP